MSSPLSREEQFRLAQTLSDEQLNQLLGDQRVEDSTVVQDQFDIANQLSDEELQQIVQKGQPQKQETFSDLLFSPEETAFEKGISETFRDVVIPVAAQVPEFLSFIREAGQRAGGKVSELFGLPGFEEQKALEKELDIKDPLKFLSTENLQATFDDFTDGKYKVSEEEKKTFKGKTKEVSKDFVKDVATLVNPATPGKLKIMTALGTALAGSLVSNLLTETGTIDEGNKDVAKLGTWFFYSFFKPGAMRKQASKLFEKAENSVANRIITDNSYPIDLNNLKTSLSEAGGDVLKRNKPALEIIDSILKDVQSGTFKGNTLTKQVKNLNKLITETGGVNSPSAEALSKVRQSMQRVAERVGVNNPEFIDSFNEANLLWRGVHSKNFISNWVLQNINKKLLEGLGGKAATAVGLAKISGRLLSAPFKPLSKGVDMLENFSTNPAARRFYLEFINSALANNVKTAQEALKNLDKELQSPSNGGSEGNSAKQNRQRTR